jgi:hypothetical protein
MEKNEKLFKILGKIGRKTHFYSHALFRIKEENI